MSRRRIAAGLLLAGGLLCASCALKLPPVPPQAPPAPAPTPPPEPGTQATPASPAAPVTPTPAPAPEIPVHEGEPLITVGLAWDLGGVTLDPQESAAVEGAGWHELGRDDQLVVTREGRWAVARSASPRGVRWSARIERGETLAVTPRTGTTTRWNGRQWRGQMRIFINPRGRLTLATRLPLEQYLAGVLPGEIGALADDVMEAGRAQAIAARSYTLFYRGRRADEGFDVYGTVEDQVYGSVESERPLASRCVESTAGQVALHEGRPIRANYCSTCGGITADVWEAWPASPLGYLVGGRDRRPEGDGGPGDDYCATSRHYRWREEWPAAEFLANLDAFGPTFGVPLPAGGVGRLVDVRVEARSRSGRVWRLVVETTTGRMVVPAWSLRQVLRRPGSRDAILRSNLFKIDVRRDGRDGRALAVVASGAGFGHGVGLCQTGALAMARQGRAAQEILGHYYRGTIVRRLY